MPLSRGGEQNEEEIKVFQKSYNTYYGNELPIIRALEKDIGNFIKKYNTLEEFIKKYKSLEEFKKEYNCKTEMNDEEVEIKVSEHKNLRERLLKLTASFNTFFLSNLKHIKPDDYKYTLGNLLDTLIKLTNDLNNEAKKSNNEQGKYHFKYISHTDSLQETLDIINSPLTRIDVEDLYNNILKKTESYIDFKENITLSDQKEDIEENKTIPAVKTYSIKGEQLYHGGKKSKKQPKKEIHGVMRCIYKIPGDRKEYVKHKGKLITIKDFKEFMKPKKQDKPKKLTKPKKQNKPKKQTKTK
jgi:hypothetical protein